MVFASQFQYVTSHNGNLAIIYSYMSFSLQQYISLLYGEFSRRRKNLDFLSFGSLVGIRRIFWNAAYDGGWQGSFCACSNLASSRSERSQYFLNSFEIFWKCSWWWWLTRDVFVLARIWHRIALNYWIFFLIFSKYFRNAADGGGWQEKFLCLLEFGIIPVWTSEIFV